MALLVNEAVKCLLMDVLWPVLHAICPYDHANKRDEIHCELLNSFNFFFASLVCAASHAANFDRFTSNQMNLSTMMKSLKFIKKRNKLND